jgi:mannose-6-phosphate isomerase-like protein (cupin superfamily)
MPLIKGKDVKEEREVTCGCMIKWYPIEHDNDLLDWLVVRRSTDFEEKWSMQFHSHPDFEEYWFVIEGKGQIICGDETYDVEPGDLVITPRGVPHKAVGNLIFVCTTAKHNVYGQTIGPKMQYVAHDKPYRDNPEDAPPVGEYSEKKL